MKIHEFLSTYRDEVCASCVRNLKRTAHDLSEDELTRHTHIFISQVIQSLRRTAGLPEDTALPTPRETAATVAHEVHRGGFPIEVAAQSFATLSVSLGEVGGRYHLAFDAEEYGHFNHAIDDSVAIAIEQFVRDTHAQHEHAASERVGILAHELRNAIASAKMAFGALERSQVAVTDRTAGTVRRSLRRMEKLIERTLVDVRLSEAPPPPLRPMLVTPLLREIESDCILERDIRVAVESDDSLAVIADEQLVTVAIGNLLQNAIKFSHDGSVITLRAHGEIDAVIIEVEDECGGLAPGTAENLFKPFVQQRVDHRGLGLGLAIARRAAHALYGEITLHDVPGKGCVFAVRLRPAAEALQHVDEFPRPPPMPRGMPASRP